MDEASSPPADPAKPAAPRIGGRRWLAGLGWLLLAALLALAAIGYSQPELLLDFVNLRYCA